MVQCPGRRARVALPLALALAATCPHPVLGADADVPASPSGTPLVALTPGLDGPALADVLDRLQAAGVRVPVCVAGAGFVVAAGPGVEAALAGEPSVTLVLPGGPDGIAPRSAERRTRALFFTGPAANAAPEAERSSVPREDVQICFGARTLEEVLEERAGSLGLRCGPGGAGRTHFIQGRSIVNAVFPESPGAPWSAAHLASTLAELARACNWWSLKAGYSASFVIVDRGPVPTDVATAAPRPEDELEWIEGCVESLGFPDECGYTGVDRFNEATKANYRGNWCWTQFVLNAEEFYGSNALAYAYLGGPHTVATRGNGGLPAGELDRVIAHEMGHIFQALDEYAGGCGGCGGAAGYLDVPNDNCVSCVRRVGKCVMRGGSEYDSEEAEHMEDRIDPCLFTKGAAGLWDTNRDGIADVLSTYPETRMDTVLPDTLHGSLNVPVTGRTWDVPIQAPPRYREPQTINTIRGAEYSVDNSVWRPAIPEDGHFTSRDEAWVVRLPELGGGTHRLRVRGVNTVSFFDRTPAEILFFVHDVKLRRELAVEPEGGGFALTWQVEGEDFGGAYRLFRRRDRGEESPLAALASIGGRNSRYRWIDGDVQAGHRYQYRLEVEIPGRGVKPLSTTEALAVLAPAAAGSFVTVAPNPSPSAFLFTVTVPRGPRADAGDVFVPGEDTGTKIPPSAPGDLRGPGDPEDPQNPFTPLWRDVRVGVYDLRGRLARDLGIHRHRETERFNVEWDGSGPDGRPLPSGVYFARVDLDYATEVTKVLLVRR